MENHSLNSMVNLSLFVFILTVQLFEHNMLSRISIIIFVALQALYILEKKKFILSYYSICNLFFIIFNIGLIYLGYSINNPQSNKMIVTLTISLIINTMLIDRLSEERNWDYYIKGFIAVSIILAIYIVTTNFNGLLNARSVNIFDPFGFGVTYGANTLGLSFSFAAVFSFYKYYDTKMNIYLVLMSVLLFFVLLTGSRKSLILFIVCFFITMLLIYKTKRIRIILISAILTIIVYFLIMKVPFFYDVIGNRVENVIQGVMNNGEFTESSARTRDNLITFGFELFKQKPYTGYGLDTFRLMSWSGLYSHNNYIEVLVSSGFFGTILYYSIYIWMVIKLYIMQRTDLISKFLFAIIVYSFIGDYILVSYSSHLYTMILAVCAARIKLLETKTFEK